MCLSIPSKIISIDEYNNALVDTMGVRRKVSLDLIDESLKEGEFVLIHVGFAMQKIDEESAKESLKVYEEIVAAMQTGEIDANEGDVGYAN